MFIAYSKQDDNFSPKKGNPSDGIDGPQYQKEGEEEKNYMLLDVEEPRVLIDASCYRTEDTIVGNYNFTDLPGKSSEIVADYFNGTKWKDEVPFLEGSEDLEDLQNSNCIIKRPQNNVEDLDYFKIVNKASPDTFQAVIQTNVVEK